MIAQPKRELELQRNQMVLDLTRLKVQAFEWQTIQSIIRRIKHFLRQVGL